MGKDDFQFKHCRENMRFVREISDDVYEYACDSYGRNIFYTHEFINDCIGNLTLLEEEMVLNLILTKDEKIVISEKSDDIKTIKDATYKFISNESLKKMIPRSLKERIDMILNGIIHLHPHLGEAIRFGKNEDEFNNKIYRYLFLPDEMDRTSAWNIFKMLTEMGYFSLFKGNMSTDNSMYYLTEKAWNRMDILNSVSTSKKIFIAMSYSKDDKLRRVEQTIKEVIISCGYQPVIIKDKEHNEYIPEEIEYEILNSRGVVVDLTESNLGAYFEAGFARGCKKQVIFTCSKNEKRHFDIQQINTILWDENSDNEDEFKERLKRRIRVTFGEIK